MRILVVWCPDWPVVAAGWDDDDRVDPRAPAAVLAANRVVAGNAAARAEGIRRGMRRRDAQSRCPRLRVLPADPARDARVFEAVLVAVEKLSPGVAAIRPGLVAVRAPARFYGGEEQAAATLAEAVVTAGVHDVRIGVADDVFTAEQAARRVGPQEWRIVDAGGSAAFLAPQPVETLGMPDLAHLLRRLGITTLAEFAMLPPDDVAARFGTTGSRLHRFVRGADAAGRAPMSRRPPPDLVAEIGFEPPLADVEAVCFSVRRTTEGFVARLADLGLVATAVRIEAEDERGVVRSGRTWQHSGHFHATDLVDRVHWQLSADAAGRLVGAPVAQVRFIPEATDPAGHHAEGLWGGTADERVERGVARVQALLGYDAVGVPAPQGGRSPADRQRLVPWGERREEERPTTLPWPGSIPPPAPTRVFPRPRAAAVLGESGRPVAVTDRGVVTDVPARLHLDQRWLPIQAWAGPWPVDERWWEGEGGLVARFQVVAADGTAWLLRCSAGDWVVEAAYE